MSEGFCLRRIGPRTGRQASGRAGTAAPKGEKGALPQADGTRGKDASYINLPGADGPSCKPVPGRDTPSLRRKDDPYSPS